MTYTPDEARRVFEGETIGDARSVLERLESELANGVYPEGSRELVALQRLVASWRGDDNTWIIYMRSKRSAAGKMNIRDVYDKVHDFDFWVRALGVCPLFAEKPYAETLKALHERRRKAA